MVAQLGECGVLAAHEGFLELTQRYEQITYKVLMFEAVNTISDG